jgi:hypothetical protein
VAATTGRDAYGQIAEEFIGNDGAGVLKDALQARVDAYELRPRAL